ncbi:CD81 antigen-like [Carassius auratus]|uniref:Tetraspanin n=1 Tax=Carassius auratus TaxID=7957 RepID=A0A6P6KAG4_CARAU|nr:CD81 antigen-like [Carassius auratus]XP_052456135.1 CD81 antigen [Carassius gibelio]
MSKVQGGMKCVKYLLFVFNFIFWLSGLLVLAVGLWLRFDPKTTDLLAENDAPEHFFIAVYILIGAGGVMTLVGFFGCFGAVRESQCLLGLFFACLLVIFGAKVAAGVFGFLNKDKIIEDVQKYYQSAIEMSNGTAITSIYHEVLDCCGTASSRPSDLCTNGSPDTDCDKAIEDFFKDKLFIIGYVGIGIAGIMIIGMIFSMVLCCAIRNSREVI